MTQESRPTLRETMRQLIASDQFSIPGVMGIHVGSPKLTVVINALTFGTELNGLRAIQRVQWLAANNKLKDVRIFLVLAHPAAALAGVDDFGISLNRIPGIGSWMGPDLSRAAALRDFFKDQHVDVVLDLQENPNASVSGMVLDIAGEPKLLEQIGDSLPCDVRLTGITAVQFSEFGSGTKPLVAHYNAKAAVEVLLRPSSRDDGKVEGVVDALLVGLGILEPSERKYGVEQWVYPVIHAYRGDKGRRYDVVMQCLLQMYAPVQKGDYLAVDSDPTSTSFKEPDDPIGNITAAADGFMILGPKQRTFTAGPYEIWWQLGQKAVRNHMRYHANV